MTVAEAINVQELLFDSPSFGSAELEQIDQAVVSSQCVEVRQYQRELEKQIEQGEASPRNLAAAGLTAYLLANHAAAEIA